MWKSRTLAMRVTGGFDEKGHLRHDGYGCDEFVHFTRYVGSCGWGVWLWHTGLFGDGPSPHR